MVGVGTTYQFLSDVRTHTRDALGAAYRYTKIKLIEKAHWKPRLVIDDLHEEPWTLEDVLTRLLVTRQWEQHDYLASSSKTNSLVKVWRGVTRHELEHTLVSLFWGLR